MLRAEHKAEGGKLIKVQMNVENNRISFIKITGDFFMHPEEMIEELEKILVGCVVDEKAVAETIRRFIEEREVTLLGASPEDFAKCIVRAGGSHV
ncbi:MAG: lipoate protein ligase C-terminal domain-containing protein [Candidatus Bathyarchaeia archaeon]